MFNAQLFYGFIFRAFLCKIILIRIFNIHTKYMNSYFIFAIVLTVAYIIYYAVIIAHDLYGKKGTDKPDEEVFDLGAPEEEESVAVTESESGFSIGSENYETESTATSSETSPEEDVKDKPGTAQEKLERLRNRWKSPRLTCRTHARRRRCTRL